MQINTQNKEHNKLRHKKKCKNKCIWIFLNDTGKTVCICPCWKEDEKGF